MKAVFGVLVLSAGMAFGAIPQFEFDVDSQKPAATWTIKTYRGATPLFRVNLYEDETAWTPTNAMTGFFWYGTNANWNATSTVQVACNFATNASYVDVQAVPTTFAATGTYYGGLVMTNASGTEIVEWGRGYVQVLPSGGIQSSGLLDLRQVTTPIAGMLVATNNGAVGQVFVYSTGTISGVVTGRWSTASGLGDMMSATYDPAGGARQVAFGNDLIAETNRAQVAEATLYPRSNPSNWITAAQVPASETDPVFAANGAPRSWVVGFSNAPVTWNTDFLVPSVTMPDGTVGQMFEEIYVTVRNTSGVTITNGKAVRATSSSGFYSGATLASCTDTFDQVLGVIGLATMNITNGGTGKITLVGNVNDIDTTAFTEGSNLWLSTTAGELTMTKPTAAGCNQVLIGTCLRNNANVGRIGASVRIVPLPENIGAVATNDTRYLASLTNSAEFATAAQGVAATNAQYRVSVIETNYASLNYASQAALAAYQDATNYSLIATTNEIAIHNTNTLAHLNLASVTYVTNQLAGYVQTTNSRYLASITNGGATINGEPITNGAAFTITGGGGGGGISNISVAGVSGTLTGSGSNVVASVSLASLAAAGVITNGVKISASTNSDWAAWAASATNAVTVTGPQSNTIATALQPVSTQGLATVAYVDAATNAAVIDATQRVAGVGYLLPASTQGLATVAQVTAATNGIDAGFLASKGAVTNYQCDPQTTFSVTNTSPLTITAQVNRVYSITAIGSSNIAVALEGTNCIGESWLNINVTQTNGGTTWFWPAGLYHWNRGTGSSNAPGVSNYGRVEVYHNAQQFVAFHAWTNVPFGAP